MIHQPTCAKIQCEDAGQHGGLCEYCVCTCTPALADRSVLLEAQGLVHGDRNRDYGSPAENDARIAALWRAAFGWDVQPEDIWQAMVLTKISRERTRPKRDNRVDVAGYAEVGDWIHRDKESTPPQVLLGDARAVIQGYYCRDCDCTYTGGPMHSCVDGSTKEAQR